MRGQLAPEHLHAIQLGDCYRRLNILARRIAKAQGVGDLPRASDVTEANTLRARIAALKTGREMP